MERYHVSLRLVNGTLERLEKTGAIWRERYRGIFCKKTRHPDIPSILLVMPDFPSTEVDSFAKLVMNCGQKYPEFNIRIQRRFINDIDLPLHDDVAAVLLYGDASRPSIQKLAYLAYWQKPVIFFFRRYDDLPFSSLNHNNTEGGMLACEYLISHGCRSLLTIHSECQMYDIEERFCAFETYAKLRNIPCRRLSSIIGAEESANYNVSYALAKYLKTYGCHFDGIFLDSYSSAQGVFSEKPLATSIEDCQEIFEAHQKTGKLFATGFVLRYAPIYRKAHQILNSGKIGRLLALEANENIRPDHGGYIMCNWRRLKKNSRAAHSGEMLPRP